MKFPQSVLAYMNDEAVRAAVDHLLSVPSDNFPKDLSSWNDAREYHAALLGAVQVRQERALLMFDLWEATWGQAIVAASLSDKVVTYRQQFSPEFEYLGERPSVYDLWDDADYHIRLIVHPAKPKAHIELGVSYWEDGVELYIAEYDTNVRNTLRLPLAAPWSERTNEAEYRFTPPNLCKPTADTDDVDLAALVKATNMALSSIRDGAIQTSE